MQDKKKILIFSTAYHPFVGGAEVAIKEITDRLGEDFEFDMITIRFDSNLPSYEKIGNVGVYRVGFTTNSPDMSDLIKWPLKLNKLLFPIISWWKAGDLYAMKQYDAIWAMMASFAGFGAMFFKLNHPATPYLLTLQEGDPIPEIKRKVRFIFPLFKKIFTKADRIQCISNYLGEWAKEMGGKNIELVPNGFDSDIFFSELTEEKKEGVKNRIKSYMPDFFENNSKILITTSRLVKKNAVDDIINSLKYLPDNIKFIVLGNGPDEIMLKKLVEKNNLYKRVWFGNSVSMKAVVKYLKISDIFIRPSLSEGFGNSFIEAMASEIPVTATPVGGIVDFLKDKETGLFCEVRNPKDIAEKIKFILNPENENLKKQIIQNAKKLVTEKYDWNIIAEDMKQKVFNNLIKS